MGAQGAKNVDSGNEWATPKAVVHDALVALGIVQFDLDPAANEQNSQAARFYDRDANGLKQEWAGDVWLNPPFSKSIKACHKVFGSVEKCNRKGCIQRGAHLSRDQHGAIDFARKVVDELESGRVSGLAWHGPVAPDTDWSGLLWPFVRVKFDYSERIKYNGESSGGTFPSETLILRPGRRVDAHVPTFRVAPGMVAGREPEGQVEQ